MGLRIIKASILSALALLLSASSAHALSSTLCSNLPSPCTENLTKHSLFNTEYKISAHYLPILPLRAIAHASLIKDKKSARLERYFYYKDASGKISGNPFETITLDITVSAIGLLGRKIIAQGKLNEYSLYYENILHGVFPKNAQMQVRATLDGIEILDLDIASDGTKMTNTVKGTFLSKNTDYNTEWRDTSGVLAGHSYKIHTEGVVNELAEFKAITSGTIASAKIGGECNLIKTKYYESEEHYGPILVKSKLTIK